MQRRQFLSRTAISVLSAPALLRPAATAAAVADPAANAAPARRSTRSSRPRTNGASSSRPQQFSCAAPGRHRAPVLEPAQQREAQGNVRVRGCDLPLFESKTKFDSGTGWPSFYQVHRGSCRDVGRPQAHAPRTEYHCARCGGHHGHCVRRRPEADRPTLLRTTASRSSSSRPDAPVDAARLRPGLGA